MPVTDQADKDFEDWYRIIDSIHKGLTEEGYRVTTVPEPINLPRPNSLLIWTIGLGPIFLILLFGKWIDKEKWAWLLLQEL